MAPLFGRTTPQANTGTGIAWRLLPYFFVRAGLMRALYARGARLEVPGSRTGGRSARNVHGVCLSLPIKSPHPKLSGKARSIATISYSILPSNTVCTRCAICTCLDRRILVTVPSLEDRTQPHVSGGYKHALHDSCMRHVAVPQTLTASPWA